MMWTSNPAMEATSDAKVFPSAKDQLSQHILELKNASKKEISESLMAGILPRPEHQPFYSFDEKEIVNQTFEDIKKPLKALPIKGSEKLWVRESLPIFIDNMLAQHTFVHIETDTCLDVKDHVFKMLCESSFVCSQVKKDNETYILVSKDTEELLEDQKKYIFRKDNQSVVIHPISRERNLCKLNSK